MGVFPSIKASKYASQLHPDGPYQCTTCLEYMHHGCRRGADHFFRYSVKEDPSPIEEPVDADTPADHTPESRCPLAWCQPHFESWQTYWQDVDHQDPFRQYCESIVQSRWFQYTMLLSVLVRTSEQKREREREKTKEKKKKKREKKVRVR